MPKVSVIIVSMNRPDILFPCLDSLRAQNRNAFDIWVTAYLYSEENLRALTGRYPEVHIVNSTEIRGFSENNNLALRACQGEYVFILNDDTLQDMPVLDRLAADLDRLGPRVAAVSPQIVFSDGRVQTCGRAPWTLGRYMLHYIHGVDETRRSRWTMQEGLFRSWTLNGACFLARREVFEQAGWFDERFMFTPEDIALGERFNAMGYEVWCDADVRITHLAGGTVSPLEAAIKPTRVKGALLYYAGEDRMRQALLRSYIALIELLRRLKLRWLDAPGERRDLLLETSRNVSGILQSSETPKEVFLRLYQSHRPKSPQI